MKAFSSQLSALSSRLFALALLSALSSQLSAQRLLDSVTLGGTNHVKSGSSFLIDSGATFNFSAGTLTGVWPIANGGTNATSASAARTSLGLVIGTNVQAYSANLGIYAGITPSANIQTFLGAADYAAMRTQLALTIGTNVQAYSAALALYSAITPSANTQTFLGAADYAAMRTQLSLVIGTHVQAYDADLTTYAGITPSANIQTFLGAASYSAMRTQLALVPGTDVLAKPGSEATGDILYYTGGAWTRLPRGSDTQVLKSTSTTIAWGTDSTGSGSLPGSPATGDLAYYDGANWVSLPVGSPGQTIVPVSGAPAWGAQPSFAVVRAANQANTSSSSVAITFDTETYDTGSLWAVSPNPTRITFTTATAGKWHISAYLIYEANSTGTRWIEITKNGSGGTRIGASQNALSSSTPIMTCDGYIEVANGDYLEMVPFQNSGSTLNITGRLSGIRVAP